MHERKRVKANSSSGTKVLKRKDTSENEILKEKLSAEDLEILNEAGCNLGDSSVMISKELKQTGQKAFSFSVKEIVSNAEIRSLGKQSTRQKRKGKHKEKSFSDDSKLKRKLFEDHKSDEVLKEPDQVEVQDFLSSAQKLSSGDSQEQNDLQKQKGKDIYVDNLAKEINQIEIEEKDKINERSLKQKVKEWMLPDLNIFMFP